MKPPVPPSPPIAVDLGACAIHAAQLDARGRPLAWVRIRRPVPDAPYGESDFHRLHGVLYRRGFRGRRVVLTAPKSIVQRTAIELPPRASGAPLDQIARSELARQLRVEPESFEFAWWDAPQPPRHGSTTRAITVTITHRGADEIIDHLERFDLTPVALLCPGSAIAAAAEPIRPDACAAGLDLGWSDGTLIVRKADRVIFERQLAGCGLAAAIKGAGTRRGIRPDRLARVLEAPPADDPGPPHPVIADLLESYLHDLREEMRSSVDYLRSCEGSCEPESITLVGGGANLPGVQEAIEHATQIPTRANGSGGVQPAMRVALALAGVATRCILEGAA
jgi:Tfp pilus assembly PilM family ATPase